MESNTSITTAKKISGDQDGDASLFGGVLTNHADRLLDMTQSANPKVRQASLELIAVLLKQGQVNPNDAIPYLFALQGDCAEPDIRALALQLLMTEGDKRPDMLRQRIRAGIKKAYDFQRALYPNKEVSALTAVRHGDAISTECVFSNVFKECLIRNRKQRHGFYSSLIGLFLQVDSADVDTSSTTHAAASREKRPSKRRKSSSSAAPAATAAASVVDVDLVRFASQILAYLPYEASGDVVHIAHEIVKARSLHEDEIVETFASLLRSVGLTSGDALDESLVDEDALETAAAAKFPSRTNQAKALSRAEFDIMAFAALCREAAALTLLLRLKCYLCVAYNVNDVRIHEYNPEGKESVADKGISKPAVESALAPFDSSVGFCSGRGLDSRAPSLDSLIRVYAEFRRALRLEHNQFDSERFQSSRTTDYDADGDGESIGNCCGQRTKGEVQSAIIDLNGAQGSTSEGSRKTMSAASPAGGDRQPASRKRSG
jgi:cohesin loading factor subunit SCC2